MVAIDAVENLLTDRRAVDQPESIEGAQFAVQRAITHTIELARDLSVVKGLIGVTIEESQDCSASLPEQHICQRRSC
ncbi:MAG: hypothetical protein DMG50_18880 [Acidobacteria bacterium]|nr:MAG: hypothetical protein DMG50_18880 [Acidobacteriota bacterium]